MRINNRKFDELRKIIIQRNYNKYAEGSVLVSYGNTKVICTASIINGVPKFLKGTGYGWLTAEYNMLPRSTRERIIRENNKIKPSGRSQEIQRLIGRSLRSAINLKKIGEITIYIDCDVIQADGGTRSASITGSCIALFDALKKMKYNKLNEIIKYLVASVSVGINKENIMLDLDYKEDSTTEVDMNIVMNENDDFIEIQGTAEKKVLKEQDLQKILKAAKLGIRKIINIQKKILLKSI
jgi:ribonuclease PH